MKEYLDILQYILDNGTHKWNRTNIETISTFGYTYKIDLRKGFPLLTTKKIKWENILFENLWFLSGNSSPDFLHKHNIHFWDSWIEKKEIKALNGSITKVDSLPEAYGEFWRKYPSYEICGWQYSEGIKYDTVLQKHFDQFKTIVDGLNKDPNNRRLVLTNWYPPSAWTAKLPPCHLMSVFNVQWEDINCGPAGINPCPVLNLHLTQRSCDVPVGVPFNIAGYAFILELMAHLTKMPAAKFSHTLVDAHIYLNQMEAVKEQLGRKPKDPPTLIISPDIKTLDDVDELIKDGTTEQILDKFKIIGYTPDGFIKMSVNV